MSTKPSDPFTPFIGPGADAFKLWISFFPTAPLFGVEWRFAGMMPGMQVMPGMGQPAADMPARATAPKATSGMSAQPLRRAAPQPETAAPAPVAAAETQAKTEAPAPATTPAPAVATPQPQAAPEQPAATNGPARPANLFDETPAQPDDLKLIRGIGPGLESKLNALGIYKFDQIAGFSEADLVWIDENLTAFKGRCFRDDWVGQARELRG